MTDDIDEIDELRRIAERVGANSDFINVGNVMRGATDGSWDNPTGAYNVALKERLTALSEADEWKEAKTEWKATGNVWYIPFNSHHMNDRLPEYHRNKHPHECVCGHKIAWHFEIINTKNDVREIVGSEHIGFWMVVRYLKENLNIPEDMITKERVDMWLKESIKTMKAEWWWSEFGTLFEQWWELISETDLRINSTRGNSYWDYDTNRTEFNRHIRKFKVGEFGTPEYQMSSIVWRWNHPDNVRAQINGRGYPNDALWADMMLFVANIEQHNAELQAIDEEREQRINYVIEERRVAAEAQRKRDIERRKRLEKEAEERRLKQIERQKLLDTAFERTCEDWGVPEFSVDDARTEFERSFLLSMIERISNMEPISDKQRKYIIRIVMNVQNPASEKQLSYIRSLTNKVKDEFKKLKPWNEKRYDERKDVIEKMDTIIADFPKLTKVTASETIEYLKKVLKDERFSEEEE